MVFSKDYFCIWYGVYHNRKIGINFREKVSEETADNFSTFEVSWRDQNLLK